MSNILLVEDDAMMREAFTIILKLPGKYSVTAAENGLIALTHCKQQTYDVILLDIMMPVMDGVEFLRQYRNLFPDASAKIIIMSNLSSGSELSQAQDYGIERAVLKSSLTPGALMHLVEEALSNKDAIGDTITKRDRGDSEMSSEQFMADTSES